MTAPLQRGWYPDPSGKPGKSYWDGHRWHDTGGSVTGLLIQAFLVVFVLPYVLVGVVIAWTVASVNPQAFAVITTVLVVILLAALLGFLYTRRKFEQFLIARRADKQNAAYLRGKKRGIYGKYSPYYEPPSAKAQLSEITHHREPSEIAHLAEDLKRGASALVKQSPTVKMGLKKLANFAASIDAQQAASPPAPPPSVNDAPQFKQGIDVPTRQGKGVGKPDGSEPPS